MYMLFKNKRPVGNIKFDSYEKCRQWARKLARKQPMPTFGAFEMNFPVDVSRVIWRTPSIGDYGYTIRRV